MGMCDLFPEGLLQTFNVLTKRPFATSSSAKRLFMGAIWALGLSLFALNAGADHAASFSKGLEAFEKKQWSEAADWFQKAIDEQPSSGGKVAVSTGKSLYVPYYHLGLAFYRAEDLQAASEAWRQSAVQGVLSKKRKKLQKQVDQYLFEINERLMEQTTAAEETELVEAEPPLSPEEISARQRSLERQLQRADRKLKRLEGLDMQKPLEADSTLKASRDEGLNKLSHARSIYEQAREDPAALAEAHALATAAASLLDKTTMAAMRWIREHPESETSPSLGAESGKPGAQQES